ncbi:Hydantoinase/oxoprolinase-domain-containing protein [Mycena polygramma]|nr:Hydantoinase/oxoprolinase-domain-containing protein [Mycena polygramma]
MPVFRIGVDVGGTNTDGVLLDPTSQVDKGILAWHKCPTTPNPSHGIEAVITTLLQTATVDAQEIASVTIGTTHFINAVLEKDHNRLAPVAVIRLCGPFSRDVYPAIDWPKDLRDIICQYCGFVDGGLEVDGEPISNIDEFQVAAECQIIKDKNIKSIVINGIFSPSDVVERQEERVAEWVRKYYPDADIVISKEVANLGFIERENAAILNASILPFAKSTIRFFENAIWRLKLQCPLFITQNDGTILPARLAARLPIRTFSSGPTNSMCGAAFLVRNQAEKESMLVVDIGGTSTDVGMLLANGLPTQAAAVTEVSGVRMNFSCPDVKSIALGGGSIVRKTSATAKLTVGPDSVGHLIQTRALVFGGDIATATDYAVASQGLAHIGDASLIPAAVKEEIPEYSAVVTQRLERIIDSMKTSDADIPVLLVGGGAILAPDVLRGASRVIKPEYASVANAIGAAIAKVSGMIDTMVSTADRTMHAVLEDISKMAIDKAVENGAIRESVKIAEMDSIPLQYIANKSRVIVKAIGDFDFSAVPLRPDPADANEDIVEHQITEKKPSEASTAAEVPPLDISSYKPTVNANREWIVSEVDLEWISTGCYILGTGGGGTPYPHFVRLREMMRKGALVRVISPDDLDDAAVVACGGGKGFPTVGMEKLPANE